MSDDYLDYLRDEAESAKVEEVISTTLADQIAGFLGTYGDAVQERIDQCLAEARQHQAAGHYKAAVSLSVTAVELIIRHFVLRPIVEGSFLSEECADILTGRILARSSGTDRTLLPNVLLVWSIDLKSIQLKDGRPLWKAFLDDVIPKRNAIVHRGEPATLNDSETAIACAQSFLDDVVAPLSDKFGFSWSVTKRWNPTQQGVGGARTSTHYTSGSPFTP